MPQNHLLIIEDDRGRREFILDRPTYSIGRDPKCDIRLISQFVSRRHATLVQVSGPRSFHYRIVDGNAMGRFSANGLLINGRKLQSHDLHNEDEVIFGPNVRAIYYILQQDTEDTTPPTDAVEFDITLISPSMVGEPEDGDLLPSDDGGDDGSVPEQLSVEALPTDSDRHNEAVHERDMYEVASDYEVASELVAERSPD